MPSSMSSLDMDSSEDSSGVSLAMATEESDLEISDASSEGEKVSENSEATMEMPEEDPAASCLLEDFDVEAQCEPSAATTEWLGRLRPLEKQTQVVIASVAWGILRLPFKVLNHVAGILCRARNKSQYKRDGIAWKVCSALVGVSVWRLRKVYKQIVQAGWQPSTPRSGLFGAKKAESQQKDDDEDEKELSSLLIDSDMDPALQNIVRMALASVVEAQSFQSFARSLQRLRLADANVGSKYGDRRFMAEIIALASLVLQQLDALDFNQPLSGLGIPSDFAVLADPVSIGLSVRARHDVLMVVCICIVSRHTGRMYSPMFSSPAMPFGSHAGEEMAALMLDAFADHPAGWGLHALRSRCSAVCGDGALCIGGPEHRHKSTDAAGKFWWKIHPDPTVAYPGDPPVMPPLCTVWDPFHRADNAAWRAIKSVPQAVQLFDVSKQLDSLFAQSEGVILFRGIAEQLHEAQHSIRAPGGTRKIVYLSGTPSSIVANYKIIVASLHGRVAWAQAGHGTQTVGDLLELGRTLSDPAFVTFALLLADVLTMVVRPFAMQVQAACEPAVFRGAELRLRLAIVEGLMVARRLRVFLRVVCLCRQHCHADDLRNLLEACLSFRGQRFSTFAAHITGIVLPKCAVGRDDAAAPLFQNTRLAYPPDSHDKNTDMCLGPHCQCYAKIAYHRRLWDALCAGSLAEEDDSQIKLPDDNDEDQRPIFRPRFRSGDVRVSVPVAFPADAGSLAGGPLESIPPRVAFLPRVLAPLPNLDVTGMLRPRIRRSPDGGDVSRCQVPYTSYLVHDAVDSALQSCIALLENLNKEFDALLHRVGCNDDMSKLLSSCAQCWDWSLLISESPKVKHVRAFRTVIRMLRPVLIHTLFPTDPRFLLGGVSPAWPTDEELCCQYMKLCERVRQAASGAKSVPEEVRQAAAGWAQPTRHYLLRPLWVNRVVEQLCRQRVPGADRYHRLRPASLISLYAGVLPAVALDTLKVSSEQIRFAGAFVQRRRRRIKRKRLPFPTFSRKHTELMPGQICGCLDHRHLMYIEARQVTVDVSSVAAALDTLPWFSLGAGAGAMVAWGAARVAHRCRVLFPPDSPCERMGSYMRLAWDQREGKASPVYVADRVFLMQAGVKCLGGERDELVVRETCRLLQDTSKYKMSAGQRGHERTEAKARERDEAVAASGRFSTTLSVEEAKLALEPSDFAALRGKGAHERKNYLRERAKRAKPTVLPDVVQRRVGRAVAQDGIVQALAVTADVLRAKQRGAADSVVRGKVTSWLETEEGRKWQKERDALFHSDGEGLAN